MLSPCNYTKVKLLHQLDSMSFYLKTYAPGDAKKSGHESCNKIYEELQKDLEKNIEKLKQMIKMLSKEDKL